MSNRFIIAGLLLLPGLAVVLPGCVDQLDVNTTGESLPVVYALINPDDTMHYVNLTRSFSGKESASVMARDASLLYFDNAEVYIEVVSDLGWPVKYASFIPMIGPGKKPGIFIESPNLLYCLNGSLRNYVSDGYTVRLIVNIPGIQVFCSASQIYYTPPEILLPAPSHHTRMNLYHGEPIQIKWEDKYGYTSYEVSIRFNYLEFCEQGSEAVSARVSFNHDGKIMEANQETSTLIQILNGDSFLSLLAQALPNKVGVIYRKFDSFDIIVASASESFRDYMESFEITSDRLGLPVSNIAGGIGLFSLISRSENAGYLLDQLSLDSLSEGRFTRHLNFVIW